MTSGGSSWTCALGPEGNTDDSEGAVLDVSAGVGFTDGDAVSDPVDKSVLS